MAEIESALEMKLAQATDSELIDVDIFLEQGPELEATFDSIADGEGELDIERLRARKLESQSSLVSDLRELAGYSPFADVDVEIPAVRILGQFWINNAVAVRLRPSMLDAIVGRDDVNYVQLAAYAPVEELLDAQSVNDDLDLVDAGPNTWSIEKINAPLMWNLGLRGERIVVAVVDTGVNYGHPDLVNRMWNGGAEYPNHGYDFESDDDDPMDGNGHGTACAGIVGGDGSAGTRTGVAPGATIMAIRVGGQEHQFWAGLQFAIRQRVDVISMSMTWKYPRRPNNTGWRRVCEVILAAGIHHANSTGNQGADLVQFPLPHNIGAPGNCPPPAMHPAQPNPSGRSSAVGCGATDAGDRLASYSGRGPSAWETGPYMDYPYDGGNSPGLLKPDVCAPGPATISCNWQHGLSPTARPYTTFGGTSAATPHVAGAMALLAQAGRLAGRRAHPSEIQAALEATAVPVLGQSSPKENHFGAGRIDVLAAYAHGKSAGWWG